MSKKTGVILFVLGLALLGFVIYSSLTKPKDDLNNNKISPALTDESAEIVGFNFILNFIKSAPPADEEAMNLAYEALSTEAKEMVSLETLSGDLARFVGVQDVPDMGASVEDLQAISEIHRVLIVGLNYSGGRVLRAVILVAEEGEWKVEAILPLEETEVDSETMPTEGSDITDVEIELN